MIKTGSSVARAHGPLCRRPLAPRVSPNKTVEGAIIGIALSAFLLMWLGPLAFPERHGPAALAFMGAGLGIVGLLGDLTVSAVKRRLAVKDLGSSLPGLGGLLDRFDSLVLAAPAVYYYTL